MSLGRGTVFDLTSEQFSPEVLDYSQCTEQSRETHFARRDKLERYNYIREKILTA